MTKKETNLIEKGYGLDKKCKTEEEATVRKEQHHNNNFFSQVIKRKENNQPFWFVYVKK